MGSTSRAPVKNGMYGNRPKSRLKLLCP